MSWITVKTDAEAIDIPEMTDTTLEAYDSYVRNNLFFVDHHDVLRSAIGEYPIATTKEQVRCLIEYLEEVAQRMAAAK
jgi:hypothetical protein